VGTSLSAPAWSVNQPYTGMITNFGDAQATLLPAQFPNLLPPGLSAAKSGTTITLRGTPTQSGTFPITIETQLGNVRYEGDYSLTLTYPLSLSPGTLAADTAGQGYSATFGATGG